MTLGLIFWILMLIWLVFGLWSSWDGTPSVKNLGGIGLQFILFLLLGWHAFGAPVKG